MSSQEKRRERRWDRIEREGWLGLVPLRDIYDFELFLVHNRGWHSAVTSGIELLHVYGYGKELVVSWNPTKRRTKLNCRRLMALWHTYDTFYRKDGQNE